LSIKGLFAYDTKDGRTKNFNTPYESYRKDINGNYFKANTYPSSPRLNESYSGFESITYEVSLNYEKKTDFHSVTGLLLYTQTKNSDNYFETQRTNFVSDQLPYLDFGDATTATNTGSGSIHSRQGLVGRIKYDFKKKYLLEFSFRYDGSDIFPEDGRFGFFPSVAGAWVISEESFFDKLSFIDFAKIRASWGTLGNDRVSPYQYLSAYTGPVNWWEAPGYIYGGTSPYLVPLLTESVLPNPHFTWEEAKITNIGFDSRLFENSLKLEFDYFYKKTSGILIPNTASVPSTIGIGLPDDNNGIVENKGFDILISYQNKIGDLSYYISPNFSMQKNKVIKYPEAGNIPEWQKIEGKEVSVGDSYDLIGFIADGLYQSQEEIDNGPTPLFAVQPGDIKYRDIDGDGAITYDDQTIISKGRYPGYTYGINLGTEYKKFEVNVLFQGVGDININYRALPLEGSFYPMERHLDHWTPENTDASYPRLWLNDSNNRQNSSYWVENASYFRLKNLEIAYSLPEKLLSKFGIDNLRIAISGTNLFTFSAIKDWDPEGYSIGYPLQKYYSCSLTTSF